VVKTQRLLHQFARERAAIAEDYVFIGHCRSINLHNMLLLALGAKNVGSEQHRILLYGIVEPMLRAGSHPRLCLEAELDIKKRSPHFCEGSRQRKTFSLNQPPSERRASRDASDNALRS